MPEETDGPELPASGALYLDTSALVKRYFEEEGSSYVDELWHKTVKEDGGGFSYLVVSEIGLMELTSAFSRRVRSGDLSPDVFRFTMDFISVDLATHDRSRRFRVLSLTTQRTAYATELLYDAGIENVPLRALDALHLAAAAAAEAALVTFDRQLAEAAAAFGIEVQPAVSDQRL